MTAVNACKCGVVKGQDRNMFHITNVEELVVAING